MESTMEYTYSQVHKAAKTRERDTYNSVPRETETPIDVFPQQNAGYNVAYHIPSAGKATQQKEQDVYDMAYAEPGKQNYAVLERDVGNSSRDPNYSGLVVTNESSDPPDRRISEGNAGAVPERPAVDEKSGSVRKFMIALCVGLVVCLLICVTCIALLIQEKERTEEILKKSEKKFSILEEKIEEAKRENSNITNDLLQEIALLRNKTETEQRSLNASLTKLEAMCLWTSHVVRLAGNGTTSSKGRVEILHNGVWGTICDDLWDLNNAKVICRMLCYSSATAAPTGAAFGQGSGRIWLDDVQCTGREVWIHACVKPNWGSHNCYHDEDAGVECA